jgi:hypothetical protein
MTRSSAVLTESSGSGAREMNISHKLITLGLAFRVPFLGSVNPSPLGDGMQ